VVDYVRRWNPRTEIAVCTLVLWRGITLSKFHDWRRRYGKVNEHNAWVPRDHWLEDWEKQAIVRFSWEYPLEGYRRLAFMMLDRDVVERFHGSIKGECLRPGTPISLEDAVRIVGHYVAHYNQVRLHSAIGYIAPADKLAGREAEIFTTRDRKLAEARRLRKEQREAARLRTVA
jgi:hypothetical protein